MSFSRQEAVTILSRDLDHLSGVLSLFIQYENRHTRRFGVNPVNRNRNRQGFYNNLVAEMRLNDRQTFINFHRMSSQVFNELLALVGLSIQRMDVGERTITAGQRLSLTIRYLASGDSMVSIGRYGYRVGQSTTSVIIRETCSKSWDVLNETVFPKPTYDMWKKIATEFEEQWNFPHCLGAMDGKHVVIPAFGKSGSIYRNYKHSHSVVLFAISDANYKFIMVEIGAPGHVGDSTIFRSSNFGQAVINGGKDLNLPPPDFLRDNHKYPYVFIGDEAFPLLPNLMRPYPGRNTALLPTEKSAFNYRLSRARRVVENAFGILSNRWRIYRRPILASKPTVLGIIKATVVLHNWLKGNNVREYISGDLVDHDIDGTQLPERWRTDESNGMQDIGIVGSNNPSLNAVEIRDKFKQYLNEVDVLSWQYTTTH